ncbi:MAG: polysaccharide biosynthesis/export family protein [Verrucomicrobia bacterium]|nr:polysaccharide biosynthesis/export family protein [Verrucomicrobiota bacterium]MBU6446427.1 polysaccharide biosynthesis/export family protein [Verrucomicrobiota bacterium]MDE3047950.1 polysaccharide biosynthesis/export family protein [Verrucomicrobiota bacterium]
MTRSILIIALLLSLACCSGGPYMGKELYGADEFVMDSYKIREGKFSILEMEGCCIEELDACLLEEYRDTIHENDILQIVLYHPERSDLAAAVASVGNGVGYRVANGLLRLPDAPPIPVAGLTLDEARQKIEEEIQGAEVFVAYRERIDSKVELMGLTGLSSVPVDGKLRLYDLLSTARIPVDANLFKSYVLRGCDMLPVDLRKLIREGDMNQNIVMRGGDKVFIAEASAACVMVMGEVGQERTLAVPNGSMPLRQALAECGGIPYTGDKSYIQIIRGSLCRPKIYTVSWEHVIHLPNDSLLLMPGDIVYVAATPMTAWHRFISQLLPSFTGVM